MPSQVMPASGPEPGSLHPAPGLFTPKLITVLREGYGLREIRADALAGLTVAIVALPLSMAIAIASGVGPERGLYTAIVGGFLVSALGGSRFQVGGPAGAFIVLVAATVMRHGIEGLILATFMSGMFLMAAGYLRLGSYIKFIPYPVTVGFTAAIALIIAASQLHQFFGLTLAGSEPSELVPKIAALLDALPTITPAAALVATGTMAAILGLRRVRPGWPGMLIAVAMAAIAADFLPVQVETIGTRFGGISSTLPVPALPDVSPALILAVLPDALAFTLLGAIESLLSAVVADGMTGRRHRSNCELVAQGAANMGAALFGGFCVTGTIARTATNVRAGAVGPVAGMLHAIFLLAFVLIAAPLAAFIPLAALAGVLMVVAWNMVERQAFAALLTGPRGDALVLMATFLLTVFRDLAEGIIAGTVLGGMLFIHRMAEAMSVETHTAFAGTDLPDSADPRGRYNAAVASNPDVVVYRLSGAFFFGSAATVSSVLDRISARHRILILDLEDVPVLDSSAANAIAIAIRQAEMRGIRTILTGVRPALREILDAHEAGEPHAAYAATVEAALKAVSAGS